MVGRLTLIATGWVMVIIGPTLDGWGLPPEVADYVPQIVGSIISALLAAGVVLWEKKKEMLGPIADIIKVVELDRPHKPGTDAIDASKLQSALRLVDQYLENHGANWFVRKAVLWFAPAWIEKLVKPIRLALNTPPPVKRVPVPDPYSHVNN